MMQDQGNIKPSHTIYHTDTQCKNKSRLEPMSCPSYRSSSEDTKVPSTSTAECEPVGAVLNVEFYSANTDLNILRKVGCSFSNSSIGGFIGSPAFLLNCSADLALRFCSAAMGSAMSSSSISLSSSSSSASSSSSKSWRSSCEKSVSVPIPQVERESLPH